MNFLGNLIHAGSNLINTATREVGRALGEGARHVTESIDDVARGVQNGGIIGGLAVAVDEFSPGNIVAGVVDSIIPGKDLPKALVEGISAGANLMFAALVPGAGLPAAVMATVDGVQALAALGEGGGAQQVKAMGGQRMQTPESPVEARERCEHIGLGANERPPAGVRAERIDGAKLREARERQTDGGFGDADHVPGTDSRKSAGTKGRDRLHRMEKELARVDAEIDRILRNPNLSFEDMVFLLMRALIRQSQTEIKMGLQEEKNSRDAARAAEKKDRATIQSDEAALAKERAKVAGMEPGEQKDKAAAALAERQTTLSAKRENFTEGLREASESRQERFEELKEAMQKISEMQQALSNILNSVHQTAMNAIGNIR
jgi:hypothetical protein